MFEHFCIITQMPASTLICSRDATVQCGPHPFLVIVEESKDALQKESQGYTHGVTRPSAKSQTAPPQVGSGDPHTQGKEVTAMNAWDLFVDERKKPTTLLELL